MFFCRENELKKIKIQHIGIILLIVIIIFTFANIWTSSNYLTVNNYIFVTEKATNDIRMVVLSDLHDHEFGDNNHKLIGKVQSQKPDLILLDGDFLNEDSENADIPCGLIRALSEFAPVYFALGNHEKAYMQKNGTNLIQQLETAGAKVLEEEYVDIEINGTEIRLGGMYDYAFGLNGEDEASAIPVKEGNYLKDFQNTDRVKVMMAHRPDSFIFGDASSYWDVDLVVSGHNHGGQVVIPFLGGIFGGDQGKFPEYVHGMYRKDKMHIFITSGLGSEGQILPRFNNLPEIAVLTILTE